MQIELDKQTVHRSQQGAKSLTKKSDKHGINTKLVHSGPQPLDYHGFVNPPVVRASTVIFKDTETWLTRKGVKYTYGTASTPTTDALADALTELEGAAGTALFPSGLAAVTVPLLAFASAGDHVLIVDSIYYPTRHFADRMLKRYGIEVEYFDPHIGSEIKTLFKDNTKVIFMESPASNTFEVMDIPAIVEAAKSIDAITMIDNTWATPLFFKPMDFGVDISIHALTKYPGGHADLVLGSASCNARTLPQMMNTFHELGACPAPEECYQVMKGLRTMGIRLKQHEKSALELARWLETEAQVAQVLHPALESHPDHEIWKRDFSGSAGLFAIQIEGESNTDAQEKAGRFVDALDIFAIGASWGGYESLAVVTKLDDRLIAKAPTNSATIRLQIGLEDMEDLKQDIKQALNSIS
jgi:cystathionine beta-lyase